VLAVEFRYNPQRSDCKGSTPLSWHLTPREKSCIEDALTDSGSELTDAKTCVDAFLVGRAYEMANKCKLRAEDEPRIYQR
jgi:hypothetical protein